ncbi:hypothetical protein BDV18DRAFT_139061 [Aspergillus unguis]
MPAIYDRIKDTLVVQERILWTTITSADPAPELKRLCHEDAVLLLPKKDILTVDDFEEAFKGKFHKFDEYNLEDVRPLTIDLMAGTITYRIKAQREGEDAYIATGSSTWGQGSDGEWRLISHQETLQ